MTPNMKKSEDIFLVSVDSRGKCTSDMASYTEHTCSREFFQTHIADNPKNIRVKSPVAALCGLDMTLFFHQHSPFHHAKQEDYRSFKPMCTNVNGIATLLTFHPETGYYNHLVLGKAYVMLNNGATPLSKEQVWGLQELINQAKTLYHRDHHHITEEGHQELLTMAEQYKAGTWAPPGIFKPRQSYKPKLYRFESGMSDQATCHHGCTHAHHDGHHHCCHNDDDVDARETEADWAEARDHYHHLVVVPKTIPTSHSPISRNPTPARHERTEFKLSQIFASGCN